MIQSKLIKRPQMKLIWDQINKPHWLTTSEKHHTAAQDLWTELEFLKNALRPFAAEQMFSAAKDLAPTTVVRFEATAGEIQYAREIYERVTR